MSPAAAGHRGASAPGKLMLAGEYVVLEGAPALVAAVGVRAETRWQPDASAVASGSLPPEAAAARARAEEAVGTQVPDELVLDVSALRQAGRKLGLGSSAAAAAASAGAVFDRAGYRLGDDAVRRRVLDAALQGHREVAPQGSGADVAAAVLGGIVRFQLGPDGPEARTVVWPAGLEVRVVWTGVEARTSDLLAAVGQLAARDSRRHRRAMDELASAADALVDSVARGDPTSAVDAADAHHRAMAALGDAAGVAIVETRLAQVADLAREVGGAAKPSGAGGGDVALAFFAGSEAARVFEERCTAAGLTLLSMPLGTDGVVPLAGAEDM